MSAALVTHEQLVNMKHESRHLTRPVALREVAEDDLFCLREHVCVLNHISDVDVVVLAGGL